MNQKKEQFGGLDKRNKAGDSSLALMIQGKDANEQSRSNITAKAENKEQQIKKKNKFY